MAVTRYFRHSLPQVEALGDRWPAVVLMLDLEPEALAVAAAAMDRQALLEPADKATPEEMVRLQTLSAAAVEALARPEQTQRLAKVALAAQAQIFTERHTAAAAAARGRPEAAGLAGPAAVALVRVVARPASLLQQTREAVVEVAVAPLAAAQAALESSLSARLWRRHRPLARRP